MKKGILFLLFCFFAVFSLPGKDVKIPLAENGKPLYGICYAPNENFAAEELACILEKMTGVKFPVCPVEKKGEGPSFIIGKTEFAGKAGADFDKFAPDEWFVKKAGKDFILAGGGNKGSLYAVYELLERYAFVSFPAWDVEIIPESAFLTVPEDLFLNGRPAFTVRTIYDGVAWGNRNYDPSVVRKKQLFNIRNRETAEKTINQFDTTKQYYYCHNLYLLVPPGKYFKTHPEYYSMDKNGKRFIGKTLYSGSQLCMTNKDVAKITAEVLLKHIRNDRKKFPRGNHPVVYNLTQLDDTSFLCWCPVCRELSKKEGSDAALLLLYINAVLDEVNKVYPDVKIKTSFYVSTARLPKSVRPRKNVIGEWIDLYSCSDCYRPITSRFNAAQKAEFLSWAKVIAPGNLAIWDYHNMSGTVKPPRLETVIDAIPADLRFYHEHGVSRYFTEMEDGAHFYGASQIFLDLQYFLGRRLLIDPSQDENKLIARFMKSHYGPAAEKMTEILDIIREGVKSEPNAMVNQITVRSYQTDAFIRKLLPLWEEAVKETAPGSSFRRHVEQEGLILLAASLRQTGLVKGEERTKMVERFRTLARERIQYYLSPAGRENALKNLEKEIRGYENAQIVIPVPEAFKKVPSDRIHVFGYPHFRHMVPRSKGGNQVHVVEDLSSPIRKVVTPPEGAWSFYEKFAPHSFGVYDYGTKKAMERKWEALPQDEKYHWFYVGRADVQPASFFWAFRWYLQADLTGVWQLSDGIEDGNKWHVYVSAKHTGPVYVKGSSSPNRLYIDYVVLTRDKVSPGKNEGKSKVKKLGTNI